MHWRRKWQPTAVFLPGESQGRGSLWAAVYGVAQSRTRLKRLGNSSGSTPLYVYTTPADGPLGCFQILAIANSVAMNTEVHGSS